MRYFILSWIGLIAMMTHLNGTTALIDNSLNISEESDTLPTILALHHGELNAAKLRLESILKYAEHRLPDNLEDWEAYRQKLKAKIIKKSGVVFNHQLPLNVKETGTVQMEGYTIKKITFQTRPGVYATANLYAPNGKGPFPGVVNMVGHWRKAKLDSTIIQPVGHSLALNGYVCLTIDPWGYGERTSIHGQFEDHGDGNNLGASLMNIGEHLLGIELSDNIRGVDLLCSLSYVDAKNIGATGASGGGNQTMWLASMDERVKAAMPVVSVGTFESYIMGTPCICEVLPDVLNFTEEAGVLALIAPRAVKMCNHKKESNYSFTVSEMIRSYENAKPIFKLYEVENNISYQLFDLTHGYLAEDRQAMLGWFDLHLKGIGTGVPKEEIPFKSLSPEELMVFPEGQRDANVLSTAEYCTKRGNELRKAFLNADSFDIVQKRNELHKILGMGEEMALRHVYSYPEIDGWERFALQTSDNRLIPVLVHPSSGGSTIYTILCNPDGKDKIDSNLIEEYMRADRGVAIVDLSGTGELSSTSKQLDYCTGELRIFSKSELWFGRTTLGKWVSELSVVTKFLNSRFQVEEIQFDGMKEAGLAGLFLSVIDGSVDRVTLRTAPVSYLFDNPETINYFIQGIYLPGFLNWGDVSLAAALSGANVTFYNPVTMSGQKIGPEKLKDFRLEYDYVRSLSNQPGKTEFGE